MTRRRGEGAGGLLLVDAAYMFEKEGQSFEAESDRRISLQPAKVQEVNRGQNVALIEHLTNSLRLPDKMPEHQNMMIAH